jgi:hypothetical protein
VGDAIAFAVDGGHDLAVFRDHQVDDFADWGFVEVEAVGVDRLSGE